MTGDEREGGLVYGGCHLVTPSGQVIVLHRRQCTNLLKGRLGVGKELGNLMVAAMRAGPEVQGLSVVDGDPTDDTPHRDASSSIAPNPVLAEPERQQIENWSLRRTKNCWELPMPPLAERQKRRPVHLLYRSWCVFHVAARGREDRHKGRDHDALSMAGPHEHRSG